MIQRIQSIWLLLAGLTGMLAWKLTFWTSLLKDNTSKILSINTGGLSLYIVTVAIIALALVTIFLFKNRKLQTGLSFLGILFSIIALLLEYREVSQEKASPTFASGSWQLGIVLPIIIAVFFFLAIRGIRKDQKLVKSLDRLR